MKRTKFLDDVFDCSMSLTGVHWNVYHVVLWQMKQSEGYCTSRHRPTAKSRAEDNRIPPMCVCLCVYVCHSEGWKVYSTYLEFFPGEKQLVWTWPGLSVSSPFFEKLPFICQLAVLHQTTEEFTAPQLRRKGRWLNCPDIPDSKWLKYNTTKAI